MFYVYIVCEKYSYTWQLSLIRGFIYFVLTNKGDGVGDPRRFVARPDGSPDCAYYHFHCDRSDDRPVVVSFDILARGSQIAFRDRFFVST